MFLFLVLGGFTIDLIKIKNAVSNLTQVSQ